MTIDRVIRLKPRSGRRSFRRSKIERPNAAYTPVLYDAETAPRLHRGWALAALVSLIASVAILAALLTGQITTSVGSAMAVTFAPVFGLFGLVAFIVSWMANARARRIEMIMQKHDEELEALGLTDEDLLQQCRGGES